MYHKSLRLADHVRRYSVTASQPWGWEVTLEEDARVRRRDRYDDWHRVERAMALLKIEIEQLTARGWEACES
jgi:hypothetical protein